MAKQLTKKQKDLLRLAALGGKDSELSLLDTIHDIEDIVKDLGIALNNVQQSIIEVKNRKAVKGNDGRDGKDGKTPTKQELEKIIKPLIPEPIKPRDGRDGQDGRDADESRIALEASKLASEELKPLIPNIDAIENDLPKLGERIRDGLELLQGNERLEMKAVKGLRKALSELEERISKSKRLGGVGGFNYGAMNIHMIDDETPSGTKDGSNKDFTTALSPNPVSSLKVYRNGQRLKQDEDYTFSGQTISFIVAPLSAEILTVDYRH